MSITPYQIFLQQRRSALFAPVQMVVFDFDCTISNVSLCSKKIDLRHVQNSDLEELIDVIPFRRFVDFLVSQGISVGIATYGKKALVLEIMNRIWNQNNPFTSNNVISPIDVSLQYKVNWKECYFPPKGLNKNTMIQMLQRNIPSNQIILIDDSEENIIHAREMNYQAVLVPKCAGFKKSLEALISYFILQQPELYDHPEYSIQQILETFF